MIKLGQLLIWVGFMIGASSAVRLEKGVAWSLDTAPWSAFNLGVLSGLIGVFMVRMGHRSHAGDKDRQSNNLGAIGESLEELVRHAETLESEREVRNVYEFHDRIDKLFPDALDRFVQARESVIHAYSMQDYANLMNHFAAGERSINRVWSASVDGYIDEVQDYIAKAAVHFREARQLFTELHAGSSS